jgi:YidC/Oxa1 family membrane protein insertase
VDGVPALGWEQSVLFLILPLLLVISQFISMELMQPKTTDPAQQQSNFILKLLPLMIGWFSLTVPSALCVYWFTNNIFTTASSLYIKNTMKVAVPVAPGSTATKAASPTTIFSPPREKPSGFAATPPTQSRASMDSVKPITAVDAEIVKVESNSVKETPAPVVSSPPTNEQVKGSTSFESRREETQPKKKRSGGKRKGKKD